MEQPVQRSNAEIAREVRGLLRRAKSARLATLLEDKERLPRPLAEASHPWPYASLVLVGSDAEGRPLLLLSTLAEHTRNIQQDPRACLLLEPAEPPREPLASPRAGLLGRIEKTGDSALLRRYLARHPSAGSYAAFKDFALYRLELQAAHLVAGFGRIDWLDGHHLAPPQDISALAVAEEEILLHMNEDHGDAVALMAGRLAGLPQEGARMVGIDWEGCDFIAGETLARLDFAAPIFGPQDARQALVALTRQAREGSQQRV